MKQPRTEDDGERRGGFRDVEKRGGFRGGRDRGTALGQP